MKDAKNMDSVFSNCTDDELMFDILFDDDETIIEALAGSDVMSKLLAEGLLEEGDDMVGENPDFDYQNDGDASYSEKDAEGTKEVKPEIGGEVGDGKEVSGKENSAEANAHDDKDEAEATLAKYQCEYNYGELQNTYYVTEYGLEYCDCDEDGEWEAGSDFDLAEETTKK